LHSDVLFYFIIIIIIILFFCFLFIFLFFTVVYIFFVIRISIKVEDFAASETFHISQINKISSTSSVIQQNSSNCRFPAKAHVR